MRILTWNTCGSCDACKAEELENILDYWIEKKDEVSIICLQELSVDGDTISSLLEERDYSCACFREGSDETGRDQLIAIKGLESSECEILDLPRDEDEKAWHVRLPMYLVCNQQEQADEKMIIITYHAPLEGWNRDMMCKLVHEIGTIRNEDPNCAVLLAGDLNISNAFFDSATSTWEHGLDYIVSWGIELSNGENNADSNSDHLPLSAHIGLN